ncbi:MAG: alpha/beta fold hydrolase, partial [Promethearchaeota archaeon]
GMILQNFVIKYPLQVDKLVFINTNAGVRNPKSIDTFVKTQIERLESLKKDPAKVFWRDTWFGFDLKFRKEMEADPKKKFYDIFSAEDLIKYIQKYPPTPQDIKNQAHAIKTHNAYDKLKQIQNKSLVLAASHDKLVPESVVQEIHKRIPNSIFKVINKAGHESHKSNAPELNKIIIDFLQD